MSTEAEEESTGETKSNEKGEKGPPPKFEEKWEVYKVKFPFAGGRETEHLWVGPVIGQPHHMRVWDLKWKQTVTGVMDSLPLHSNFALMEFLRENRGAFLKNDDGSYYSEMQIREEFYKRERLPLPGDTIFWEWDGEVYRVKTGHTPATLEDLQKRKEHCGDLTHGQLEVIAKFIREEDPSEWKEKPWKAHYRLWVSAIIDLFVLKVVADNITDHSHT